MDDIRALCADLGAESEALTALVEPLDTAGWSTPTPADGWTVHDQMWHLASTDERATLAASDPQHFIGVREGSEREVWAQRSSSLRRLPDTELLTVWKSNRSHLLEALARLEPKVRVPWFGPAMSTMSFTTARLMETWAHGVDVADALGAKPPNTLRLKHIAHLGVRARPYSYTIHALAPPSAEVFVELRGLNGCVWRWGTPSDQRISGSALDFCLVVTRRRHVADTSLLMQGELAREWMLIAQAFAGSPGTGRKAGQFAPGSRVNEP